VSIDLQSLYSGTNKRVTVAQTRENRSKNCFSNFYPYDDCRVVLQPVPVYGHKTINSEHSDYINASYIDGFSRPRKFIATQVPLPHTVVDFWQMVWQEKVACLVLLSLAKEEGRGSPGERYCSDDVGTWCIGPFLVSTTAKTQCAHHTIRHISVQVPGSAPVEVCQLQLTNLSRQSVSYVASTLLAFHHRFTEFCPTLSTKPTVVHCSTGAGLSGVFVAVDRLIEEMWAGQGGGVNVWGVVNSLRRQRPRMVATLEQYVLVHEVILEMIKWGCTEIPVCELTNANTDFGLEGEGEGESVLEKLFKAAGPVKPDPGREEEQGAGRGGCLPCAHPLWISHSARGILAQSRTVPYHRPVSISSYWPGSGWLVTRSPSHSSVSRFWRTVVNMKCSIIIDFSSKNKERYRYWPDGDGVSSATLIAGQYAIHRGREEGGEGRATGDLKTTSLTIENLLSGQTQVVTQMVVVEWTGEVTVQMCGAVDTILRAQNSTTHTPVLLHCNDGVSEVGVVSVVSVAVEQGVAEGLVDIPCAIRKIRTQLPTAIASLDEMELVLKTVTALLNRKLH
jgi:protein tyrosine phosphatase